jgi:NAD(P)-dependent dehydrogenase (short-subunit alcohol dehydrogenase family)
MLEIMQADTSLAKKNIRCNAILPGSMMTNVGDAMAQGFNVEAFDQMKLTMAMDPGMVDLDKAAETVMFLCSDGASMITGSCVEVDRGWTAW